MFARSIAIAGAAAIAAGVAGSDAQAFGRHHKRCCQPTVCYKQVMSPPVYKTVMVRVMVRPETCTDLQTPPVYGVKPERVLLQPERRVAHYTPAVHEWVRETYLARPGYTKWKTRRGCCGELVKCAIDVPPLYRSRARRVEVTPASHWVETRPAVTGVIERRVMIRPGSVRRVCQPPVYEMVPKQVLVSPGTAHWVPVAGCRRW